MKYRDIFINCPFTDDYSNFFKAAVFTVIRSGYRPRCALEADDGTDNRFEKICRIIEVCRLGIHDLSKTELDTKSRLPRFNMPLELGVFLAAKRFGSATAEAHDSRVPGGKQIAKEFQLFTKNIPKICETKKLHPAELTYLDYRKMAEEWIIVTNLH